MRRLMATGLIVGSLIAAVLATPSTAVAATCRVEDARTGEHTRGAGPNLQRAIDAAEPGDQLIISGICRGNFQMREELRLTGVSTPRFPKATLDAGGHGRVLRMRDGGIIRSVRIRDGRARNGGGIYLFDGTLELRGATEVIGNRAARGGGIYDAAGDLILSDSDPHQGERLGRWRGDLLRLRPRHDPRPLIGPRQPLEGMGRRYQHQHRGARDDRPFDRHPQPRRGGGRRDRQHRRLVDPAESGQRGLQRRRRHRRRRLRRVRVERGVFEVGSTESQHTR